jgi:hypothetical protein
VEEAKAFAVGVFELLVVGAGLLEEVEGAVDVGAEEGVGAEDAAVYVGLGCEVDYGAGVVVVEDLREEGGVVAVAVDEGVSRVVGDGGEVFGVAGVGEGVEIDDGGADGF